MKRMREEFDVEMEDRIAREREAAGERYHSQLEREETQFQNQRRRLIKEMEDERARHTQQLSDERAKLEAELQALRTSENKTLAAVREDSERAIAEAARRNKASCPLHWRNRYLTPVRGHKHAHLLLPEIDLSPLILRFTLRKKWRSSGGSLPSKRRVGKICFYESSSPSWQPWRRR